VPTDPNATDEDADFFPSPDAPNIKTFECLAVIVPFASKNAVLLLQKTLHIMI
jgi:hypothetical protein